MSKQKVYAHWNGKNVDGKTSLEVQPFLKESLHSHASELTYEIGVDTFSAEDLQPGANYEQ